MIPSAPLTVVSWLWHDPQFRFRDRVTYGPEHVNVLRSMVRRNLSLPHEFVCITDDPAGLDPDIRVIPLWDDLRNLGGCYTRLKAFAPEMAEIIGPRFVWIDIDCVVTGSLDPLFSRTEDFVIWANGIGDPYCGSMVMMTAGARPQVWTEFDPIASPRASRDLGYIGTDQGWISACLGTEEATWTAADGVLSRIHVMGGGLPGRARRMGRARDPKDARIVFFHGPYDPQKLRETIPWIAEHWR